MSNIVRSSHAIAQRWSTPQVTLIRDTVGKELSQRQFDQFLTTSAQLQLDPLKKQIVPILFKTKTKNEHGKDEWFKQMTIIVTIDGLRSIAARSGEYRPDEQAARFTVDESAKDPNNNPLGLVSATVTVYRYSHGAWHPITGEAYWEEYAPVRDEWAEGDDGKRRPTGKAVLDKSGGWGRMPRVMLAKCAEAIALRKGWPEDLSGIYGEEEMDRAKVIDAEFVDLTPSELAERGATERRLEAVKGKDAILIDWMEGGSIDRVEIGQLADKCMAFLNENRDSPGTLAAFRDRNLHSLREFWARSPNDALAVKKAFEEAERQVA